MEGRKGGNRRRKSTLTKERMKGRGEEKDGWNLGELRTNRGGGGKEGEIRRTEGGK